MSDWTRERWTGWLGLAAAVVQLVAFGFAFSPYIGGGPPPSLADRERLLSWIKSGDIQILTSALLFFLGFALYLAFLAGFRAIVADAAARVEWLASAAFASGVAMHRPNEPGYCRPLLCAKSQFRQLRRFKLGGYMPRPISCGVVMPTD